MTETKYIFPKQPQSVAVLVFITVLIVLLFILTVMVYMRNRKLKSTLEEQMAERRLLDKICADFTAVYYVELNTGSFEILHINDGTNVKKMNLKQGDNFNSSADQYAVQYLYDKERQEFKDWISTGHLKEQLSRKERITYHYRSKPNPNQHEFFEAQAVKIYEDEKHFFALVGFRHIDDIMEKETTIQNQLKQALDETRLSNEIISAIAKSYCSIYRIAVQKDFFEEVSNDSEIHKLTGNRGCASEKLYQLCDSMVAPEYRPLIRPFLDVSTLSARLKMEECISTEYRMCDGSWHRMLFIVKKRDESGNVTHVLCTVRSISDSKRREEDLNFVAEAAKREAEMKTRFLATMSHDIRTPLNGIIGMVNMGNQYADDPQMLSNIMDNAIKFSQASNVLTVGVKEETLDEDRSISVLSYNLETLLAEKMQTILARGLANTRMRDFYDVYEIMNSKADQISFDVLKKAFAATCMKRETSFGEEEVRETLDKIKDDSGLEEMWNRFKRVNYFVDDLSWGEVSETIVDNIEKNYFFSDQVS